MTIEKPKNIDITINEFDDDYYSFEHEFFKLDSHENLSYDDKELYVTKLILKEKETHLTIGQFIRKRKIHKIMGKERPSEVEFYEEDAETGEIFTFPNSLQISSLQKSIKIAMGILQNPVFYDDDLYPNTSYDDLVIETIGQYYHATKKNGPNFDQIYDSDSTNESKLKTGIRLVLKTNPVWWDIADRTIKFKAGNIYKQRNRTDKKIVSKFKKKPVPKGLYVSKKEFLSDIKKKKNLINNFDAYKAKKNGVKKITLIPADKKTLSSIIDKYIDNTERENFLELTEKYLKTRKKLQFFPNYTRLLTSVLEIIISKYIYKYSTSKQGFYCKPTEIKDEVITPIKADLKSFWISVQSIFQPEIIKLKNIEKPISKKNQKNITLLEKKLDQIATSMKWKTGKILSSRPFSDLYKEEGAKTIYFGSIDNKITPTQRKFTVTENDLKNIKEIFDKKTKEIKEEEDLTNIEILEYRNIISQAIEIGNARTFRNFIIDAEVSSISADESFSFGNSERQLANKVIISDFIYSVNESITDNLESIKSEFPICRIWPQINKNLTIGLIKISKIFLVGIKSERLLSYLLFSKFIDFLKEVIILTQSIEKTDKDFKKHTKELKEIIKNIKYIDKEIFPLYDLIENNSGFHLKFKDKVKKIELPCFKNRITSLKAISEWFAFHLETVQICQTKLVEMDIPDKKEQILKLVKTTCDLIPILKEHQKKPYVIWSKDTVTGMISSVLKNSDFDIETLNIFYNNLESENFPDFPEPYFKNLISVDFFKRLTSEDDSEGSDNIILNRFYDILQSEIHITKFYQNLKKSTEESFPGMNINNYYQWKKLNFRKEENESNKERIFNAIEKRSLLKPLNHEDFEDFFNKNKKATVLTNINFLKAIAGQVIITSKSDKTFSTDPALIIENFHKWFNNPDEPTPIKDQIEKGKEYIKLVYNLQKKYKLNFSSFEQISGAEKFITDTKDELIEKKNKFKEILSDKNNERRKIYSEEIKNKDKIKSKSEKIKKENELKADQIQKFIKLKEEIDQIQKKIKKFEKTSKKIIENIKTVLKKPPHSKKTYFSIFAKKLLLMKTIDPENYKFGYDKNYELTTKFKKKYKSDFSSLEQISKAEINIVEIKDKLIKEKAKDEERLPTITVVKEANALSKKIKKTTKEIKDIETILEISSKSENTHFNIFANKIRLMDIVLNYKELIFKQRLVNIEGERDKIHIIRHNFSKDRICYYYVYEINNTDNSQILLSSLMNYNEKFPYHQQMEMLFKNLPENKDNFKIYSYDNANTLFPMGYLFDIFDHYFDLKKKFFNFYNTKLIDPALSLFFDEDKRINEFTFKNLQTLLKKTLDILKKIYVKEIYEDLKSKKVPNIDDLYKVIKDDNEITEENLETANKIILKSPKIPEIANILNKKIKEIEDFSIKSNYSYKDLNDFNFSMVGKKKKKNLFDVFKKKPDIIEIFRETNRKIKIQIALTKYRLTLSDFFDKKHPILNKSFKTSFLDIKKALKPYLYDTRVPAEIFNQTEKFLKKNPNYNKLNPDQKKLYHLFKQFKEICFVKDIPLIFFGKRKGDQKFLGFTGLITFPAIQIEPSGAVTILNSWQKMFYKVDSGLPSINTTGIDLGLRTPVAIGDVTKSLNGLDSKIHYSQEISEEKLNKLGKEEISNNRDNLISQANIISKKNIKKAFYLQKIAQKTQQKKARLHEKPYLQSAIYKSSLTDKQNNINTTVAHKLASSIIQYAKTKTSEEIKDFNFKSNKVPNFENSFLRINTENLLLTTKKKDPFAVQKSQWLYGKINTFLEESCQIQGINAFTYTPPAYTSKISHLTYSEGKKGYLVKINTKKEITIKDSPSNPPNIVEQIDTPLIRKFILKEFKKNKWIDDGKFHPSPLEKGKKKFFVKVDTKKEIIVKNSPSKPISINDWLTKGTDKTDPDLHPLVHNAILRRARSSKWISDKEFHFIPLGSGNVILLNPNGELIDQTDGSGKKLEGRIIIDRDSNAAINIATYNPFLYSANVINLQIDRIIKKENISKAQKRIKSKLTDLISKFQKVLDYHLDENNFSYNYLYFRQVLENLHREIAETVYDGIIYHINKPRKNNWYEGTEEVPTFTDWIVHINKLINIMWEDPKKGEKYHIRSESEKDFIKNISEIFSDPSKIANINSDLENIIVFFRKELNNEETYGKIPIKSLLKLSSVDSAAANHSDEIEDNENDNHPS